MTGTTKKSERSMRTSLWHQYLKERTLRRQDFESDESTKRGTEYKWLPKFEASHNFMTDKSAREDDGYFAAGIFGESVVVPYEVEDRERVTCSSKSSHSSNKMSGQQLAFTKRSGETHDVFSAGENRSEAGSNICPEGKRSSNTSHPVLEIGVSSDVLTCPPNESTFRLVTNREEGGGEEDFFGNGTILS